MCVCVCVWERERVRERERERECVHAKWLTWVHSAETKYVAQSLGWANHLGKGLFPLHVYLPPKAPNTKWRNLQQVDRRLLSKSMSCRAESKGRMEDGESCRPFHSSTAQLDVCRLLVPGHHALSVRDYNYPLLFFSFFVFPFSFFSSFFSLFAS